MLRQICELLTMEGMMSQQHLMRVLHVDPPALQPMLDFLLKKGRIQRVNTATQCRSLCSGCSVNTVHYYQSRA